MNTRYNILLAACLILTLGACNKKLNIAPEGVLTEKGTLSEKSTAENLLAGAYQQMFNGMDGDAYTLGDLTTGIAVASFNSSYYTGALAPNDNNVESFWDNSYAAINLANVIITKLKLYAQFDTATQNQFIGEAKFIRAFTYFHLLKLYGDGALQGKGSNMCVPLRIESFDGYDGSQNIPRATNDQVYAQILKDLGDAVAALPVSYNDPVKEYCRANSTTAAALAARVELYRQDYTDCNAYCDKVLNDGNHALQASPAAVFPNNSSGSRPYAFNPEIIFAFPVSYNNDPTQYSQHNIYYIYGYAAPDSAFLSSYAPNDIRASAAMIITGQYAPIQPVKFSDPTLHDNLVMLRLAETVLTKAEALAYLNGVNQTSVDLLNSIHQRAFPAGNQPSPYTVSDFATPQALISQILQERRWELAFEGQDRFDRIRSGIAPNPVLPANRYALPVPQREIDITGGLIKQNPGYVQ